MHGLPVFDFSRRNQSGRKALKIRTGALRIDSFNRKIS
jgi:hypothetical protein